MSTRLLAGLAGVLLSSSLLAGCGAPAYVPRPSPRIQVVPEGNGIALVKNSRRYSFNMFGGGLDEAVQGNAEAEAEASTYKSRSIAGFVISTIGSIGSGVGAAVLIGNEVRADPSSDVRIASLATMIGSLALAIVGSVLSGSAQPHLWNSINIYNDSLPAPGWPPPGYPAAGYGPGPVPLPTSPAPVPLPAAPAPAPAPAPTPTAPSTPAPQGTP